VARAAIPAEQLARENTLLLGRMFFNRLRDSDVVQASPNDLRGDRFGLQRSRLRLDAATATRRYTNPGMHQPGKELVQGMEVVITPDITVDPDEIIAAAMDAGLAYSEQLTRETSLVVCNQEGELRGKAMHARRKGIPLVSDTEFMQLTQNVRAGTAE
jgi:DNA polymerase III epsilon subunit